MKSAISVGHRFLGSSQESTALDRARTLRFVGVIVDPMPDVAEARHVNQHCLNCCDAQSTSDSGHFRPIDDVGGTSAIPPIATESLHSGDVGLGRSGVTFLD
jgi:hypothetical protein